MFIYIIILWFASALLAYALSLNGATLFIGKSVSSTNSATGFQDAITPPWSTKVAILAYLVSIVVIGYGWYLNSWIVAIIITLSFFVLVAINKNVIIPKSDSEYFKRIIMNSMMQRYANCVKSGDSVRATAVAMLLAKLGAPVPDEFQQ